MNICTIIDNDQYEQLKSGVLRADFGKVINEMPYFIPSYVWIVDQMKKRIGSPPDGVVLPVWGWHKWAGKNRPDLRSSEFYNFDGWAIQMDVPEDKIVLSDFHLWHCVLNNWPIVPEDEEQLYIDKYMESVKGLEDSEKIKMSFDIYGETWEKIFDMDFYDEYLSEPPEIADIQATAWEWRSEWIINEIKIKYRKKKTKDKATDPDIIAKARILYERLRDF